MLCTCSQEPGQIMHGFSSGRHCAAVCSFPNQMLRSRDAGFILSQAVSQGAWSQSAHLIMSLLEITAFKPIMLFPFSDGSLPQSDTGLRFRRFL